MVNEEEGKRKKWTENEICIDHPLRETEAIRDPTIFTAGLTTGITGMHCDIAVLDDVVVRENAYTKEGRERVKSQYSLLSSIEGADSQEWVVGTRYDPNDLYNEMLSMKVELYGEDGSLVSEDPLYEIFERQVEDQGDGQGEFLWPRQQRYDGKWFGFNHEVLARKKAQYLDKTQFFSQYYNNPNASGNSNIDVTRFQYYERRNLEQKDGGDWFIRDKKLRVYAAIDFAFSLSSKSDYTALVVVGIDEDNNYYVLDIDRFKTDKISVYFDRILASYSKWGFRKLRAEVTVGQKVIVQSLKDDYIKKAGIPLSIDEYRPNRHEGTKEERISVILQPRYENMQIFHYKGGNCQSLEEELMLERPSHDDIKDALANAINIAKPPIRNFNSQVIDLHTKKYHSRFGGII
jgi:phage terminase large subunit-like protein